jgi:hypothetical protein
MNHRVGKNKALNIEVINGYVLITISVALSQFIGSKVARFKRIFYPHIGPVKLG